MALARSAFLAVVCGIAFATLRKDGVATAAQRGLAAADPAAGPAPVPEGPSLADVARGLAEAACNDADAKTKKAAVESVPDLIAVVGADRDLRRLAHIYTKVLQEPPPIKAATFRKRLGKMIADFVDDSFQKNGKPFVTEAKRLVDIWTLCK